MYNVSMTEMTATEARSGLPGLLDRVEAGEEVTITRHGRAVAVLVRPDALRYRRAGHSLDLAASVRDQIATARSRPLPSGGGFSEARAAELIASVRAGREGR